MKKIILIFVLVLAAAQAWPQDPLLFDSSAKQPEDRNFKIPLIGDKAPAFTAESTNGIVHFPGDFGKDWKILLSHPQDFTPVCSSEILELSNLQPEFDKLNTKLVVVSVDPLSTHVQWKKALEGLSYKDRQPVPIKFPLVADDDLVVSKEYGMIHAASNNSRDVRGVYIVDPDNVIEAIYFYPSKVGRNMDELVRMVKALQTTYTSNVMTPANWKSGNDLLIPYIPDEKESKQELEKKGIYNLAWFMWYKKPNTSEMGGN
jgi:peroxiredoxin (alkyl hydroperoxide reductase subunit C)